MSDPELMARAQQAAERLERSWERWRRMHGLAAEQAQPVSSYVGYSLAEPWGRPRVVFGVAAEEAERLSDLLEADGADPRYDQGLLWEQEPSGRPALQQVAADRDEEPGPADPASLRADLAGWTSGELPGQASAGLAAWPQSQPARSRTA